MSAPTPKRIALLVTALMVVSAVALILSASDYEGQDGAETTENPVTEVWTDAKAVIFDSSSSPATTTYYTSIQGAIDTVIEAVETDAETTWKWTIYVKAQTIDTTVNVPYQSSTSSHPANSPGLVEITLKGISSDIEPEEEPENPEKIRLSRGQTLTGPMFHVEGRLVLENISIAGDGGSDDDGCAVEVAGIDSSKRNAELFLKGTSISEHNGVAINVDGGNLTVDAGSTLDTTVFDSSKGIVTARTSSISVYGNAFNPEDGDGYHIVASYDDQMASNGGAGLTVYVNGMEHADRINICLEDRTDLKEYTHLTIEYEGDVPSDYTASELIAVTLNDNDPDSGFMLGQRIIDASNLGMDIVSSHDSLGMDGHHQYYLITPIIEDHSTFVVKSNGEPVANELVILSRTTQGPAFAGITDENGILAHDVLDGMYNLQIGDESRGSIAVSSTTTEIESGNNTTPLVTGDVNLYIWSIDATASIEGDISATEVNSSDPLIEEFSSHLSTEQDLIRFIDIKRLPDGTSMVFSLEFPSTDLGDNNIIVFREHDGQITQLQNGDPHTSIGECFAEETVGEKVYVTIRAEQFSIYALGSESPVPEPEPEPELEPEYTTVTAALEDRMVRISVGPESYKEYCIRDADGNIVLGWASGASGLIIRFDLLPPGAEYRVMGRHIGTTAEILEASIVAPKDPVIEVISAGVDSVTLASEEMVGYRLLREDGTAIGDWIPGDGAAKTWADLDPTLDYYAEATSTSDGMTLSAGPVLVKNGTIGGISGLIRHGGMYLVVTGLEQGWTCETDATVYCSTGSSLTIGPLSPGTVTVTFVGPDGEEERSVEVIVPSIPQDAADDADTVTIAAEDGVMYMLQDHTGATVSEGWIDGEGELSWSVDPSIGYFVTMVTGNENGTVMFPMTEIKRPAEMIPPSEGT